MNKPVNTTVADKVATPSDILDIVEMVCHAKYLVEAIWMAATPLGRDECNAIQTVAALAHDVLVDAQGKLEEVRS